MTIREAIRHYLDAPDLKLESAEEIIPLLKEHGLEIPKPADYGRTLMALYEGVAEHQLIQPTFITEFPIEVSPLARKNVDDPRFVDRFELIIGGKEVANAFSELNDPVDQKERFEAQVADKNSGDDEAHEMDEDYIRALEVGMPPAAGQGIGIDRLVMLMTNQDNIREVILFPHMRPEQGLENAQGAKEEQTPDQTGPDEG
jgi:lysyl-tRNA synthetase class 2